MEFKKMLLVLSLLSVIAVRANATQKCGKHQKLAENGMCVCAEGFTRKLGACIKDATRVSPLTNEAGLDAVFGHSAFSDLARNDYQSCLDSLTRLDDLVSDVDPRVEFRDILTVHGPNKKVFRGGIKEAKLWPAGIIPLVIADGFTNLEKRRLYCALKYFHEKTCLRFVPRRCKVNDLIIRVTVNVTVEVVDTGPSKIERKPERVGSECYRDYVYITKSDPSGWCYSDDIGKKGGRHVVNLGPTCWKHGTVVHELMHAAGIFHEHARNDRDSYVEVHWDQIPNGSREQFKTADQLGIPQNILGPYDYRSIMHYPSRFWDRTVLSAKTGVAEENNRAMGNRQSPTPLDTAKINKLYSCPSYHTTEVPQIQRRCGQNQKLAENGMCVCVQGYIRVLGACIQNGGETKI